MSFKLLPHEVSSSTWTRIAAQLETRLAKLQRDNEAHLDPVKTAAIRGAIKEIRAMLAFAKPDEPIEVPQDDMTY